MPVWIGTIPTARQSVIDALEVLPPNYVIDFIPRMPKIQPQRMVPEDVRFIPATSLMG
jgi:hypothetical protein